LIDDYPEARELVAKHEELHTAHATPIPVELLGISLIILPGVFRPDLSMMGRTLVAKIEIKSGESVLDLGTGSGFQAILAAKSGAGSVVAVDKQPSAVNCARVNVERNDLTHLIAVRESDLFSAISENERFDVILFNFPFPPFEAKSEWQKANFDPGHYLLTKFLDQAKNYLSEGGRIGMCWSDIGDTQYYRELVDQIGYSLRVIDESRGNGINAYIFELRMP